MKIGNKIKFIKTSLTREDWGRLSQISICYNIGDEVVIRDIILGTGVAIVGRFGIYPFTCFVEDYKNELYISKDIIKNYNISKIYIGLREAYLRGYFSPSFTL